MSKVERPSVGDTVEEREQAHPARDELSFGPMSSGSPMGSSSSMGSGRPTGPDDPMDPDGSKEACDPEDTVAGRPDDDATPGEEAGGREPGPVRQEAPGEAGDPHPAWLATWRRLRAGLGGSGGHGASRESMKELHDLRDQIAQTPAETLAGLQAQAELIAELAWNDVVASTARQLIAGLKRQRKRHDHSNG